jgi:endoglucanase
MKMNQCVPWCVVASVSFVCTPVLYGQNSIDIQLQDQWEGGYNADILIEVADGGSTLNGWQLSWRGDPQIEYAWNCELSGDGDRTVLDHVYYNQTVEPGNSTRLGFTGIGSWPPSPSDVRINGVLVDVYIDGGDGGGDGDGDGDDGDDDGHDGGDGHDDGDGHDGGHQECCFGDLDGNNMVDGNDLSFILIGWNSSDSQADLDQSNLVDGADLALLLSRWGSCGSHSDGSHDSGDYMDLTMWGEYHDSNDNSHHEQMVGGRTAITTEAMVSYNNLRAFLGLSAVAFEDVGQWAFNESLTNNSQGWGTDVKGVGLWYAMQGAKVGWITDEAYDPQILADIQRTARTVCNPIEMKAAVMDMVRQYGHEGYADYLLENQIEDTFINTIKMEPHYGGWMHARCHGFRSVEGVAINHDINHLTVLSWDQMEPFMNDTFDWPQWPALNVSDSGVIEYFQSMVMLGDPLGNNM